ncbi:MAG: hypothetical protein WD267_02645 [Balneolales bacterium]
MIKRYLNPLLLLFILVAATSVGEVQFSASIDGTNPNEIMLKWTVQNEQDVESYLIKRKMKSDQQFRNITDIGDIPAGTHEFTDRHLSKKSGSVESVSYKLYAKYKNVTTPVALSQTEVNYTTNTVRRTWGNIKSMFQ